MIRAPGRRPSPARTPARATIRGATASTWRLTGWPSLSRTPGQVIPGDLQRRHFALQHADAPGGQLLASSPASAGPVCGKNATSAVTLDELAGAPPTDDPRIQLRAVIRHGMIMLPLTRRAGRIQACKLVIPASSGRREPDLQTHEGYEWVYVLNGRLRLVLGDHDLLLSPGEAAEFDTRVPHWSGAADAEPVEFLGRPGERAHLRARPRVPRGGSGTAG